MSAQSSEAPSSGSSLDAWLSTLGFVYDPALGRVRNPFDFLRAEDDLALQETFVPTLDPASLSLPFNVIVLGPAGSGKSALRMELARRYAHPQGPKLGESQEPAYDPSSISRQLREILSSRFSEDELRTLCFDLGIDYDDLPDQGKVNKARELISYHQRRNQLHRLIETGRATRTDIVWPDLAESPKHSSSATQPQCFATQDHPVYSSPLELLIDLERIPDTQGIPKFLSIQDTACICLDVADRNVHRDEMVFAWPRITKHLRRLNQQNMFIKAFLPLWCKPYVSGLQVFEIRWSPNDLTSLIKKRVVWASKGKRQELDKLCDETFVLPSKLDLMLCENRDCPRDVLSAGRLVLINHALGAKEPASPRLSLRESSEALESVRSSLSAPPSPPSSITPLPTSAQPLGNHLCLDLKYDQRTGEVIVKAHESATNAFEYSFALPDLSQLPLIPGKTSSRLVKQLGIDLYRGFVRRELLEQLNEKRGGDAGCEPIFLHLFIDPADVLLIRCPWELLHDRYRFLVKDGELEIVRHLKFEPSPRESHRAVQRVSLPLSVLYVAPRPSDPDLYALPTERAALAQVESIKINEISPPTYDELRKRIQRNIKRGTNAYLLHLDGWGQPGSFLFEAESRDRGSHPVSAENIGSLVANRGILVAAISACHSAVVETESEAFSSIVPRLILAGVPGVLGMQSTVETPGTERFMERFYGGLTDAAQPCSFVCAFAYARKELIDTAYWYVPVLYLGGGDREGRFFEFSHEETNA